MWASKLPHDSAASPGPRRMGLLFKAPPKKTAECLTTSSECDNNGARAGRHSRELWPEQRLLGPFFCPDPKIPPREDGMDIEKDSFEDDNELSRLEDEELGGETEEIVEEEEELVIVGEEPEEVAPAPKPASKPAAKKRAKKAAKKKPARKKAAKKAKPKKKAGKKKAKKASKKKRRR